MASSLLDHKQCTGCGETKPIDAFYRDGVKNGRRSRCKTCSRRSEGSAERRLARRRSHLRHSYGISLDEYEALSAAQGRACAICHAHEDSETYGLRVDHDHSTGRVRGLLCHSCNVALGHLRDDPALLRRAIDYLA